jgi:hypothetical protein
MLGFKTFYSARRVLIGIEFVQRIHKGQYDLPFVSAFSKAAMQQNPV